MLSNNSGLRPDFAKGGPFVSKILLNNTPLKCPKNFLAGGIVNWNTPDGLERLLVLSRAHRIAFVPNNFG